MASSKLLVGALCATLAGCSTLPSEPVKGDYPPITQEIKTELENEFFTVYQNNACVTSEFTLVCSDDENRATVPFSQTPKKLINYWAQHTGAEYKKKELNLRGLDDLVISIITPEEVREECSEHASACARGGGKSIIQSATSALPSFLQTFMHEFGHVLAPTGEEFASEAHTAYGLMQMYEFSKPIGSLLVDQIFLRPGSKPLEDSNPFERMYRLGKVYTPLNLFTYDGNTEAAMEQFTRSTVLLMNTHLQREIEKLPEGTLNDYAYHFWEKALNGWLEYELTQKGHLSQKEASEYVDYLRIQLQRSYLGRTTNNCLLKNRLRTRLDSFLRAGYENPYFNGKVIHALTPRLITEIDDARMVENPNWASLYSQSERVIVMNSVYPCTDNDNPYACPLDLRTIRLEHVRGYYLFIEAFKNSYIDAKVPIATEYVHDFAERFYPGTDVENGYYEPLKTANNLTNNYFISMAYEVGIFNILLDQTNTGRELLTMAVTAECTDSDNSEVGFEECENKQMWAKVWLELNP